MNGILSVTLTLNRRQVNSVCPTRGKSQKTFLAFAPLGASLKKLFLS
jgi:hypothetical protein